MPTIHGELKRYLRDHDWAVRVPRGLQERALLVARATSDLTRELGRPPSTSEIGTRLALRVDDVLAAAEACTARYSESLDAPPSEGDASCPAVENIGSEDPALERIEARQAVAQAVSALGARERELIRLRFFEQRTQTEIAARLGISQMQVSRLLRKVLSRLHTLAAG